MHLDNFRSKWYLRCTLGDMSTLQTAKDTGGFYLQPPGLRHVSAPGQPLGGGAPCSRKFHVCIYLRRPYTANRGAPQDWTRQTVWPYDLGNLNIKTALNARIVVVSRWVPHGTWRCAGWESFASNPKVWKIAKWQKLHTDIFFFSLSPLEIWWVYLIEYLKLPLTPLHSALGNSNPEQFTINQT